MVNRWVHYLYPKRKTVPLPEFCVIIMVKYQLDDTPTALAAASKTNVVTTWDHRGRGDTWRIMFSAIMQSMVVQWVPWIAILQQICLQSSWEGGICSTQSLTMMAAVSTRRWLTVNQLTICFHVDNCKISHLDPKVASSDDTIACWLLCWKYESAFEDKSGKMTQGTWPRFSGSSLAAMGRRCFPIDSMIWVISIQRNATAPWKNLVKKQGAFLMMLILSTYIWQEEISSTIATEELVEGTKGQILFCFLLWRILCHLQLPPPPRQTQGCYVSEFIILRWCYKWKDELGVNEERQHTHLRAQWSVEELKVPKWRIIVTTTYLRTYWQHSCCSSHMDGMEWECQHFLARTV